MTCSKMRSGVARLEGLFQDLPDYVCLIFVYDLLPFKANGNTRLGKLIKKVGVTVEFQPQQQSDLNAWIRRHFKALGKEIDNSTAEYLTPLRRSDDPPGGRG